MREIKFRAWDSVNQKMYTHDECVREGFSPLTLLSIGGRVVVWMQYTGLQDKNGKEIYEGDVIEGDTWKEPYAMHTKTKMRCGVVFRKGGFTSDWVKRLPKGFRTILEPQHPDCEVIGNIYEHPHLLAPEQEKPPQNAGAENNQ